MPRRHAVADCRARWTGAGRASVFSPNGDCEWMLLAPDDDQRFKPGKWAIDSTRHVVLNLTSDTNATKFRIASLSKDTLRRVPIGGQSNP